MVNAPAIGQAQAAQLPAQPEPPRPQHHAAAERPPRKILRRRGRRPALPVVPPVKVDTPVRVRINSWVELRGPNGDILAQTYVRAGESYVVPAGIAYRVIAAR